jgi:uncharacterized membrane protein
MDQYCGSLRRFPEIEQDGMIWRPIEAPMKILRLLFKRETAAPMLALTFASVVTVSLVVARTLWTGHLNYAFLVWNLFLAWLPLIFALVASEEYQNKGRARWRFFAAAGAWLIFFPNAPYILTDLIHLTSGFFRPFWVDLSLILLCAITGLVLGFVSLYLMQSVVARMFSPFTSWIFIAGVAGLTGLGIYIGRFLRFNSWDIILQPGKLYHRLDSWVADPLAHPISVAFPILFAIFLFLTYLMLYALTHLSPAKLVLEEETVKGS